MTAAAILFAIAALGGMIMAMIRFSGRDYPPAFLAVVHGVFAAAGIVTLFVAALAPGVALTIRIALILFIGAAIGGFALIYYHAKSRPLPISYVVIHGLVAVVAFIILIVGIMTRTQTG
jgi:TRAP-type C4-dicarboxylate transport system permease large subunit